MDSVADWLNRDGHDQYRYVTLGFGEQDFAAGSAYRCRQRRRGVEFGRMLPELTSNGAGSLSSSKYFGEAGLDALRAMLQHADQYGLKWVIVRDPYYDPLL